MSEYKTFKGFFSYSHHDAKTDPNLVEAFTTKLEKYVNAKLVNVRFRIWRDENGMYTGDRWDEKIEAELRASHVLIIFLTPCWIESDYTRKEYSIFEEVEKTRSVGNYIVPISVRPIDRQKRHFTPDQSDVYTRIMGRQCLSIVTTDFLELSEDERTKLLEKVADDIEGMIERLRLPPTAPDIVGHPSTPSHYAKTKEFKCTAHNYNVVDFVSSAEVIVEKRRNEKIHDIYAQVNFVERLYVQSEKARIEFGVRRAYLSVSINGSGNLSKSDYIKGRPTANGTYYVALRETPHAITVCMNPTLDKSTLAELALPPTEGDNYWSSIAFIPPDVATTQLKAELIVSLCPEGLHIVGDNQMLSNSMRRKITAIMNVAAMKNQSVKKLGQVRRSIPILERS